MLTKNRLKIDKLWFKSGDDGIVLFLDTCLLSTSPFGRDAHAHTPRHIVATNWKAIQILTQIFSFFAHPWSIVDVVVEWENWYANERNKTKKR